MCPSALSRSASACEKRRPSGRRQYHRARRRRGWHESTRRPETAARASGPCPARHQTACRPRRDDGPSCGPEGRAPECRALRVRAARPTIPSAQRRLHHRGKDGDDIDFHTGGLRVPNPHRRRSRGPDAPLRSGRARRWRALAPGSFARSRQLDRDVMFKSRSPSGGSTTIRDAAGSMLIQMLAVIGICISPRCPCTTSRLRSIGPSTELTRPRSASDRSRTSHPISS